MKILQLISTCGFYGAENVVLELSRSLRDMGHDVIVGCLVNSDELNRSRDLSDAARTAGLETVLFTSDKKVSLKDLITLRRFMAYRHIEIVHSHNYKSNFYGLLASVGLPVRLYSTSHNWPDKSLKMQSYKLLDILQLRFFHRVVAVSDDVMKELRRWRIPDDRTSVILNGIDVQRFSSSADLSRVRKELGIGKECIIVGTIGRLTVEKGHLIIIEAARQIVAAAPETKFLIVGDGPLMDNLKRQTRDLPFIFTGVRKDVEDLYCLMDIFILPSLTEGLPMSLLEAMCSGRPVIASDVGNIGTVLKDPSMGILIKPGSAGQLAKSVLALIADERLRCTMGAAARKRVQEFFSRGTMADMYNNLYLK